MSKTIRLVVWSFVVLFAIFLFATAQEGDILLLDGKKYFIYTNPLAPFLQKNPGKLPRPEVTSSSNWRGYIATWAVKNDRLVLVDVEMKHAVTKPGEQGFSTEPRSVMSEMFPGQKDVLADWFSGHVVIPDGELVHYVHMGYASIYEKYILLRVENGVVTRKWKADTAGFIKFRDAQFSAYKKTEEYRQALERANKEGSMSSEQNEEFLREFYSERYMSMIFDERP